MSTLILLNGPPASGKSTLAQLFVDEHPLALNLDIDVIRGLLGQWLQTPTDAGLAARALALSMAKTHLNAGHDVIVPQFLGRPGFIDQLASLATNVGAVFIEVALNLDRDEALAAFAERSQDPSSQAHRDASALVAQSSGQQATDTDPVGADPVDAMFDAYIALVDGRGSARHIDVIRGDVAGTYASLLSVLAKAA